MMDLEEPPMAKKVGPADQPSADLENSRSKCSLNTEAKQDHNTEQLSGKAKFPG